MDHLKITFTKLSVDAVTDLVSSPKCGATSVFLGTTRDNFDGKQVVKLEYQAYESMALKVMKEVCKELRDSWPDIENVAIYHRLGTVPVQETSVIIAVSSPHRASAIAATKQCIEQLKGRVPIWKKEVYDDETPPQWKENSEYTIKQEPLEIEDWIEIKHEPIGMDYNDSVVDYSEETPFSTNVDNQFRNERVQIDDRTSETHQKSTPTNERTQNEENYIDDNLVQVKATTAQLKERIAKFIERKREAANLTNVLDFCGKNLGSETNNSCARIDATVVRRKDSKSHLKVRRVVNLQGPQTLSSMEISRREGTSNAVEERVSNAENYLQLNGPVPADIYQRLKRIEDRITELESLSPEYSHYWTNVSTSKIGSSHYPTVRKRTYSISDIEARLEMLQKEVSPRK